MGGDCGGAARGDEQGDGGGGVQQGGGVGGGVRGVGGVVGGGLMGRGRWRLCIVIRPFVRADHAEESAEILRDQAGKGVVGALHRAVALPVQPGEHGQRGAIFEAVAGGIALGVAGDGVDLAIDGALHQFIDHARPRDQDRGVPAGGKGRAGRTVAQVIGGAVRFSHDRGGRADRSGDRQRLQKAALQRGRPAVAAAPGRRRRQRIARGERGRRGWVGEMKAHGRGSIEQGFAMEAKRARGV